MTSVLPSYGSSILINPSPSSSPSSSRLPHSWSASTSRSAAIPPPRRIRFAPLPDPRRAVFLTDNGNKLPLPDSPYVSSSPYPAPISLPTKGSPPSDDRDLSTSASSSDESYHIIPQHISSSAPSSPYPSCNDSTPTLTSTSSSWTTKPKKLFKPFLKRSSSPCPPMSAGSAFNISAEELLTLGTINLFRSSSRPDDQSEGSAWGKPLSRWTSASSFQKRDKDWSGSPLARSQSDDARGRSSSAASAPTPLSASVPAPGRKGTRMLNGRVYGAPRQRNHFATARDTEPEFVEWGYGGMGSVKATAGAGVWSRVQGGAGVQVGNHGARSSVEDDDDGSGLGWVKKRKEARERERREKEEKERAEVVTTPTGEERNTTPMPERTASPLALSTPPAEGSKTEKEKEKMEFEGEHHILTAVNIPAPPHHGRTASRTSLPTPGEEPEKMPIKEVFPEEEEEEDEDEAEAEEEKTSPSEEDEDEDEDEEAAEETRKTALGAGVEKISRHKEDR